MAFSVIYPHTAFVAIGANTIKPRMLERSVRANGTIVTVLDRVRVVNPGTGNIAEVDDPTGRTWAFIFVGAGPLSGPETTALNAIVAAHAGVEVYDPSTSSGGTSGQVWTSNGAGAFGWQTPPGSVPGGAAFDLQYNNSGVVDGAAGYSYALETGLVVSAGTPLTPSGTGFGVFADPWSRPRFTEPNAVPMFDFADVRRVGFVAVGGGSTTVRVVGGLTTPTAVGTAAGSSFATTSARAAAPLIAYTPLATANTICSGVHVPARLALNTDSSHSALRSRFAARFAIVIANAANARFFAGLCETPTSFSANPTSSASGMGTRMGIGFGDGNSGVLQWITTQTSEANSVVSTGITATDGHMYHVEMMTMPASSIVLGTLWRQTTAGGSWAIASEYSYDSTANVLSATAISIMVAGGNGASASAGLSLYVGHATSEMR